MDSSSSAIRQAVNYGLADALPQTLSQWDPHPKVEIASFLTLQGPSFFYLKSHGPPGSIFMLLVMHGVLWCFML